MTAILIILASVLVGYLLLLVGIAGYMYVKAEEEEQSQPVQASQGFQKRKAS